MRTSASCTMRRAPADDVFIEPHQVVPLNNERRLAEWSRGGGAFRAQLSGADRPPRSFHRCGARGRDHLIFRVCAPSSRAAWMHRGPSWPATAPSSRWRAPPDSRAGATSPRTTCSTRERPTSCSPGRTPRQDGRAQDARAVRCSCAPAAVPAAAGLAIAVSRRPPTSATSRPGRRLVEPAHLTTLRAMLESCGPGTPCCRRDHAGNRSAWAERRAPSSNGSRASACRRHHALRASEGDECEDERAEPRCRKCDGRPTYRAHSRASPVKAMRFPALRVGINPEVIARACADGPRRASAKDAVAKPSGARARRSCPSAPRAAAGSRNARKHSPSAKARHVREPRGSRAFVERVHEAEREIRASSPSCGSSAES